MSKKIVERDWESTSSVSLALSKSSNSINPTWSWDRRDILVPGCIPEPLFPCLTTVVVCETTILFIPSVGSHVVTGLPVANE